jgi:hypothetical protein
MNFGRKSTLKALSATRCDKLFAYNCWHLTLQDLVRLGTFRPGKSHVVVAGS